MFSDIFEISPKMVPTGQKFVQKILSFKSTAMITSTTAVIPNIVPVIAEPNIVYGSMYFIAIVLPPKSIPHTIAAIKYFKGKLICSLHCFFINFCFINPVISCKIPSGQKSEQ